MQREQHDVPCDGGGNRRASSTMLDYYCDREAWHIVRRKSDEQRVITTVPRQFCLCTNASRSFSRSD